MKKDIFKSPLDVGFAPFQLVSGDGMGRDAERECRYLTITSRNNKTIRNNKTESNNKTKRNNETIRNNKTMRNNKNNKEQ